jgi:hypothetical protein
VQSFAEDQRRITESTFDTMLLHGRAQVVGGPSGIKGGRVTSVIFNEAVPENVAYAFSQEAIDNMLAESLKPHAMTITFDRDDDQDSFRNLLAASAGLPVVPADLASRMKVNPA